MNCQPVVQLASNSTYVGVWSCWLVLIQQCRREGHRDASHATDGHVHCDLSKLLAAILFLDGFQSLLHIVVRYSDQVVGSNLQSTQHID